MNDDFLSDPTVGCAPTPDGTPHPAFCSDDIVDQHAAKRICRGSCPRRIDCLRWAIGHDEKENVWAGYLMSSVGERRDAAGELALRDEQQKQQRRRDQHILNYVDWYGREIAWLTSRGRNDQQIAQALRTTPDTIAAVRDAYERKQVAA